MKKPPAVLIAQSGGPTAVINSSLFGVFEACQEHPDHFGAIWAGRYGIEGILKEELLDLSGQKSAEMALLRTTPAAGAIGTCRYKLKSGQERDLERVLEVLRVHDIGYLFYLGGNDSMDTAHQITRFAAARGQDLMVVGVPKTVDNDLGDPELQLVDHTPGYGSTARYWAQAVLTANEENRGSCRADPVLVMQTMGRHIGFIPAAARLADPARQLPLLLYLPEARTSLPEIADHVNDTLRRASRCLVVVSEGLALADLGNRRDEFGHIEYGACDNTVQQVVVSHLNRVGLATRGLARGQVPGTDQRHSILCASIVDLEEAYQLGRHAVGMALTGSSGWMASIRRAPGSTYRTWYDHVRLEQVANVARCMPTAWRNDSDCDVTDAFIDYARPLIGMEWAHVPLENGLPRFAHLEPRFALCRCAPYKLSPPC